MKLKKDNSCFIIGEAGINHDGDINIAKELIDVAAEAKVDAVKFQLFDTNKYISDDAFMADYHIQARVKNNETFKDLLKRLELNKSNFHEIYKYAQKKNIMIFSTPFDVQSANFLNKIGNRIFKVASFNLTNFVLIENLAKKKQPLIISTGLHSLGEIENVVNILKRNNKKNFALLQCTSHYPAKPSQINLRAMKTIRSAFDCMVGYSDHTMGINISLAAVALGAKIIEKHFTLDSRKLGCDHKASIEPHELKNLVSGIREVEASLGTSEKIITKDEKYIYKIHRPSIVSKCLIRKGLTIKRNMLDFKKPGTGISPLNIDFVIGRKTKKTIKKNRLIKSADLI